MSLQSFHSLHDSKEDENDVEEEIVQESGDPKHKHKHINDGGDKGPLSNPNQHNEVPQVGQLLSDQLQQQKLVGQLPSQLPPNNPHVAIPMLPPFPILLPPGQSHPHHPQLLTPQQIQMLAQQNQLAIHPSLAQHHSHHQHSQVVIPSQVNEQMLSQGEPLDPNSLQEEVKPRKTRWRPTQEQRQTLESIWNENPYPDQAVKQQITKEFGSAVTYKQITSWFKHKREVCLIQILNFRMTKAEESFNTNTPPLQSSLPNK